MTTERTATAFKLPAAELGFIRAVSQRTGVPQSRIFRDGGLAEARKVAIQRGVFDAIEADAAAGLLPPPERSGNGKT